MARLTYIYIDIHAHSWARITNITLNIYVHVYTHMYCTRLKLFPAKHTLGEQNGETFSSVAPSSWELRAWK